MSYGSSIEPVMGYCAKVRNPLRKLFFLKVRATRAQVSDFACSVTDELALDRALDPKWMT